MKGLRILPFREGECRSNHWFFSLYLKDSGLDRDTVIEKLQAQHIQTRPVWALIHEQADYPATRLTVWTRRWTTASTLSTCPAPRTCPLRTVTA